MLSPAGEYAIVQFPYAVQTIQEFAMSESSINALEALDSATDCLLDLGEPAETSVVLRALNDYTRLLQHVEAVHPQLVKSLCRIAMLLQWAFPSAKGTTEHCLVVAVDILEHAWDPASAVALEQLLGKHLNERDGRHAWDLGTPDDLTNFLAALRAALDHIKELVQSLHPPQRYSGPGGEVPSPASLLSLAEIAFTELGDALNRIRRRATQEHGQETICSVFAPEQAAPDTTVLIQVWLHPIEVIRRVADAAAALDRDALARGNTALFGYDGGFVILRMHVPRGAKAEPSQQTLRGSDGKPIPAGEGGAAASYSRRSAATFAVTIEPTFSGPLVCRISVARVGKFAEVPIASVCFNISVQAAGRRPHTIPLIPTVSASKYRTAFVSYAHHDLSEVIKRVQVLEALGIEFFQDFLSIRPGEQWADAIYENIEQCNLFLLFWSSAAAESEWVRREIELALKANKRNGGQSPDIIPIVIESPSAPNPPPELAHLQFSDTLLY
jgi:hypothetical protein